MRVGTSGKRLLGCAALLLQTFAAHVQAQAASTPEAATRVRLESGILEGSRNESVLGFKGIPYAAAPVGQWRWREPQAAAHWEGVRSAKQIGNACIQKPDLSELNGGEPGALSEDCLFLNVWTPDVQAAGTLPVMVWIHGGGLAFGSGGVQVYDGEPLARRGVVIVTLNYRMGALGFFSHPALDAEPTGYQNFGLLDQIAALQWVQKNIAAFGGDPGNVTIFGQSAGAESVLALYGSPLARGLFHKGIAQSPYGIPSHSQEKARKVGSAIASALGLDGARASAEQLRSIPAHRFGSLDAPGLTLSPGFITRDAVLPDTILQTFQDGNQMRLPLIIGSNSDEASVATAFGVDPAQLIESLGKSKVFVKPLYPKVSDNRELGRQVMRDAVFTAFARRISYLHSQQAPTWRYYFSYVQQAMRRSQVGVPHAGEIAFTMDTGTTCRCLGKPFRKADAAAAKRVADSWTAFARTGRPQTSQLPTWSQDSVTGDQLMEFSDTSRARTKFMQPRIKALILGLKAAD